MIDFSLLDNPIWNALTTTHQSFSIGNNIIKSYRHDVLPFVGLREDQNELSTTLLQSFSASNPINSKNPRQCYVKEVATSLPIIATVPCIQMVCEQHVNYADNDADLKKLGLDDKDELFELVNLVQPGFMKANTYQIGDYYGIRKDDRLVAVAGERMKMTGLTEVSAVCTHPDHTGKGYAQKLVQVVCREIFKQNRIPFLHVVETNVRAIKVYELLGFKKRRDLVLMKVAVPLEG